MLETLAIPVWGYRTSELPAFYSDASGVALSLDLDESTPWFGGLLRDRFASLYRKGSPASGHIDLFKTMQNVSLSGDLTLGFDPVCANCGVTFYEFDPTQGAKGKLALRLANFVAPLLEGGTLVTSAPDVPAAPKS